MTRIAHSATKFYSPATIASALLQAHAPAPVDDGMCCVGTTIDAVATALEVDGPFDVSRMDVHDWVLQVLWRDQDGAGAEGPFEANFRGKPHPRAVNLLDRYVEACLPVKLSGCHAGATDSPCCHCCLSRSPTHSGGRAPGL